VNTSNTSPACPRTCLSNSAGLSLRLLADGSIEHIGFHALTVNLFAANPLEGGPANLWLRRRQGDSLQLQPLLGPRSPLRALQPLPAEDGARRWEAQGEWQGLALRLQLRLAAEAPAWFWHLQVDNLGSEAQALDLIQVQDIALAEQGSILLNEYYISQYLDLSPMEHPRLGHLLAARQNQAQRVLGPQADGEGEGASEAEAGPQHPWALIGSLRRGLAFATDGLQVHGLASREGALPVGIAAGLGQQRLQHEHALLALRDEPLSLAAGASACLGFFGLLQAHHGAATPGGAQADPAVLAADLARVDALLALPEARPDFAAVAASAPLRPLACPASLFASAPLLVSEDLSTDDLDALFGAERRHEEREGAAGPLLSFSHQADRHVVLRAKELRVQRPHGHILHSGAGLTPDEAALTSTVWMGGVFHSMLTQGHVSINRLLSTVRSALGLFRSQGQRVFVRTEQGWQLLGLPSAFEIAPQGCRWFYKHAGGLIELSSEALPARSDGPQAMCLRIQVREGAPAAFLISHHIALGGDGTGEVALPPLRVAESHVFVGLPAASGLAARFPGGGFMLRAEAGTGGAGSGSGSGSSWARVGGDELLFADGRSQGLPYVCLLSEPLREFGLLIEGRLIGGAAAPAAESLELPRWHMAAPSALASDSQRLLDMLPWFRHNALIHYLAPRGLEQFSGGGWGTRDVCQGPLEMLLALGRTAPVRDLLCRVFAAQNADGDWPQWFMFYERERTIRAGDSHGDIVFWPLLALARYLLASGDAGLLEQALPFFAEEPAAAERGTLWQHVERALALIQQRRIAGTELAAYGHGDWNDSLQPADPALREHLCSAWTVTLHHQVLLTLAQALELLARPTQAAALRAQAAAVQADFQRLLLREGVVAGYALFDPAQPGQAPELLLHPDDRRTGLRYSLLPMMHAILDDMLSPEQASAHLALIERELKGPDGARLFDRPLPYRGGPQTLFQRAETSSFFGREIGVMYMHAHLRYAEMLAHLGEAELFFEALRKIHPIGLREHLPSASPRQANCYYSSSDAAFPDRCQAQQHYQDIASGRVALDGGWRIYSSGPGIALGLLVGSFLGLRQRADRLLLDPVLPPQLDGLLAEQTLRGQRLQLRYRLGPRGCGVQRLRLNGQELAFTRAANRYRAGAAELPWSALEGLWQAEGNLLELWTD